jgi:hypothetical protein
MEQWKQAGRAGREADQDLWQQFRAARQRYFDRRHAAERQAKEQKEALVREAEALMPSADYRAAKDRLRQLMEQWKQAGWAGPEVDQELWSRFQGARQQLWDAADQAWRDHQWAYVEQVEARIRNHEGVIGRLESV